MRREPFLLLLAVALLLSVTIACDDNDSPLEPVIEEPVPVEMFTDEFTGQLRLGEAACHLFTAVNVGSASMRITSLEPLATLTVGLGIGLDDGDDSTECAYFASDRSVRVLETLESQLIQIGDYCVCIFDVGNIFPDQTVTYTFQVEHP